MHGVRTCRWSRVRFAGANRLCVELRDRKDSGEIADRVVEPYALRRTRDRNIILHAVDVGKQAHRSFRVDRILSLEVTSQPFSPRYEVEFAQVGPIPVPPTTVREAQVAEGRPHPADLRVVAQGERRRSAPAQRRRTRSSRIFRREFQMCRGTPDWDVYPACRTDFDVSRFFHMEEPEGVRLRETCRSPFDRRSRLVNSTGPAPQLMPMFLAMACRGVGIDPACR